MTEAYGIATLDELLDSELMPDADLRSEIGLSPAQIKVLRTATRAVPVGNSIEVPMLGGEGLRTIFIEERNQNGSATVFTRLCSARFCHFCADGRAS